MASSLRTWVLDWLVETADQIPWDKDPRFPKVANPQHETFIVQD